MKSFEYFKMPGKVNIYSSKHFLLTHNPNLFLFSQSCGIKFEFDIRIILYKYTDDVAKNCILVFARFHLFATTEKTNYF